MKKPNFCRLPDDEWGVSGSPRVIIPGATIYVAKKSGELVKVIVGPIIERGRGYVVAEFDSCEDGPPRRGTSADTIADAYRELWVAPGAPKRVIDAAYKALAFELHPDRGGSVAAFQRLEAAYSTISETNPRGRKG